MNKDYFIEKKIYIQSVFMLKKRKKKTSILNINLLLLLS